MSDVSKTGPVSPDVSLILVPSEMRLQIALLFPKLPPAMKEKLKEVEQKK